MSRKVLVTGADGFIGSHLVEHLVHSGYSVRAFVFYNSLGSWGWLENSPSDVKSNIDVISGDIRDYHSVKVAMEECDVVLHLAALIAIPYSYHSPRSYIDTNVVGTLNVLQAARDLSISHLIHTSTSEVYGSAQFVPITESHPLNSQSPYAASKVAADQLALSFYRSFELPVTIIRPFNTYGPRQSARAVIPTIITQVASGAKKLRMGSLEPTRDFTYVDDTVRGFAAAIGRTDLAGEVINLGTGEEVTVGKLIQQIGLLMGQNISVEIEKLRVRPKLSEVDRLCSANAKAQALLGWSPLKTGQKGLNAGLIETIRWFTDHNNLALYKPSAFTL